MAFVKLTEHEKESFTKFLLEGSGRKLESRSTKDELWREVNRQRNMMQVIRKYIIAEFSKNLSDSIENTDIDTSLLNFEMEQSLLKEFEV